MDISTALSLAGHLGLDIVCLLVLVGVLHRRRTNAPEMALVLTALNVGLFAAVTVISLGDFASGIGFGLFGLLSLVRLRSAAFTLKDVSYTFVCLVLALVNGLPGRSLVIAVVLDVVVLVALWITDESRSHRPTRLMRVTLDRAVTSPEEIRTMLELRLAGSGMVVTGVAVDDIDLVRDTTRVSVRHEVDDAWWAWHDAKQGDEAADLAQDRAESRGAERDTL